MLILSGPVDLFVLLVMIACVTCSCVMVKVWSVGIFLICLWIILFCLSVLCFVTFVN